METEKRCSRCGQVRSLDDFYKSKGKVNGWCKFCFKDWYRERGGYSNRREVVCGWCCQSFTTPYGNKAKYCSRDCKDKGKHREHQAKIHAAKPDRRCVWCGIDLPKTMRADAKFCSEQCNSKAHQSVRRFRRRLPDGEMKRRRIALPSFIDIAERDHWTCGICGKPVNQRREFPDPLAGSIDHLLPVSKGGGHEMENLQLSHFVCNWSKRDRAADDRLRLL